MAKQRITSYTFIPGAKQITFPNQFGLTLDGFLLITNLTSNTIIFNFASSTLTGTLTGNSLLLAYDTTAMAVSDALQIWYDDGIGSVNDASVSLLEQLLDTNTQIRNSCLLLLNQVGNNSFSIEDLQGDN